MTSPSEIDFEKIDFCPVSGQRVFSRPEWFYESPDGGYRVRGFRIGESVIVWQPRGRSREADSICYRKITRSILQSFDSPDQKKAVLFDYRYFQGSSFRNRRATMSVLQSIESQISRLVIFGVRPSLRGLVRLGIAASGMQKKVALVRDYSQALGVALNRDRLAVWPESSLTDHYQIRIRQVMEFMASMTWGRSVDGDLPEIPEDDPFFDLYRAAKTVQEDLHSLWVENDSKTRQLQEMTRDLESRVKERTHDLARAREAAEREAASKHSFLVSMSHEIRTPIHGITSTLGILDSTPLDEDQKGLVEVMNLLSNNLLGIVNNILDFSKIEAGRIDLESIPFSLTKLVRNLVKQFEIRAEQKGLKILKEIDEEIPRVFIGDPVRIQQILVNFMSNAVKFTPSGWIRIQIREVSREGRRIVLELGVRDSGIGIPEDRAEKLFQAYGQTDSSVSRQFGGTGLGLVISQRLADLMGGEVGFESEQDKGAYFWVRLPLEEGRLSEEQTVDPGITTPEETLSGLKILLAEDNRINQKVASRVLEKMGHRVYLVKDGREAVEACRFSRYDLVFMDVQMPDLDGIEATRLIRAEESKSKRPRVKIVAITANAMVQDRKACLNAGMDAYISKPYRSDDLRQVIAEMVPRSRESEE